MLSIFAISPAMCEVFVQERFTPHEANSVNKVKTFSVTFNAVDYGFGIKCARVLILWNKNGTILT